MQNPSIVNALRSRPTPKPASLFIGQFPSALQPSSPQTRNNLTPALGPDRPSTFQRITAQHLTASALFPCTESALDLSARSKVRPASHASGSSLARLWMDEIHFAPLGNHEKPLCIGIYKGIIIPRFLKWCRISSIHSRSAPLLCKVWQSKQVDIQARGSQLMTMAMAVTMAVVMATLRGEAHLTPAMSRLYGC